MIIYNPSNWYWYVSGDQTKAFSSKSGDYVQSTDETFQAWLTAGGVPTPIDTEANLGVVLSPFMLRPVAAGVLAGYLDDQSNDVVIKKIFKLLFQMKNDILALQGKQPITAAQAKAYVRSML
jgi:hypothetical protein